VPIAVGIIPKGRPSKHRRQQIQLAKMITKERATRLEGSFRKEKEHDHLKKLKPKQKLQKYSGPVLPVGRSSLESIQPTP